MKHVVMVYVIKDNDTLDGMFPIDTPHPAYVGMTPGIKLRQVGTGAETFIPYARWFDEATSRSWNQHEYEEYNWLFLRSQQNWANDMLKARGHLLLNDVHDTLGMSRTAMGAVVGWAYSQDNPTGDNYVDFGCWAQEEEPINADESGGILLTFNVDGPILHRLA